MPARKSAPAAPVKPATKAKPAPKPSKTASETPKTAKTGGRGTAADKNAPVTAPKAAAPRIKGPRGKAAEMAELDRALDEELGIPPRKKVRPNAELPSAVEPSAGGIQEIAVGDSTADGFDEDNPYGLKRTQTPGVYINSAGVLCDVNGIMLDFAGVKKADDERFERVIGEKVDTPAKLLKAVSLDPTLPLTTRMEAAKSAAPYFDRKKPIGIDGGEDGKAIPIMSMQQMRGLSGAELQQMKMLVMKSMAAGATDVVDVAETKVIPQ